MPAAHAWPQGYQHGAHSLAGQVVVHPPRNRAR